MGSKKQIIAVVLLVALLGLGGAGFSWQREEARTNAFGGNGYIHISDMEKTEKRVMFRSGTTWKRSLSDTVTFENSQGEQQKVSVESFLHYDDGCLAAFTDGVVVDLNDLATAKVTNHYALSSSVVFENNGAGYVLPNNAADTTFTEFLWKLSESKYMLVAPRIQLRFSETDVREVEDYVEVTYIDEGVIQLQTKENVWQTISNTCLAELDNDEKVDFNLRNVQDDEGEVLADFSKMVLDSENNIEVTPLTEDLRNVHENVIPHFEITAENGEAGEAGEAGEKGSAGENGNAGEAGQAGNPGEAGTPGNTGEQGAAGQSGNNGAAGASGTNGSAGAPGAPGAPGEDGESPSNSIDTEVLKMPEFSVVNWNPTATGCSGKIMVAQPEYLQGNTSEKYSRVYLVDALSGAFVAEATEVNGERFNFLQASPDGYSFSFSNLSPDHEYVLMVEAPIMVTYEKGTYIRTFITKKFYTDSVGISMEAGACGVDYVTLTVRRQDYAAAFGAVDVYIYATRGEAIAATAAQPGSPIDIQTATPTNTSGESWTFTVSSASSTFSARATTGLESNTNYYARVMVTLQGSSTKLMPAQVLTMKTLKQSANIAAPVLSSNRSNWGFDVGPGTIADPDGGIIEYRYEFIQEGNEEDILKRVETTSPSALTVPIDGVKLKVGEQYRARLVVTFFDNEKTYEITSGWSNAAAVEGGKLPIVQYVNAGQQVPGGTGESTLSGETSQWYDQLAGTVRVIPGSDGAKLMLGGDHVPYVTIRASGYYYVKFPVYLEGQVPEGTQKGTYLVGTVDSESGEVDIQITNRAMTDLKQENTPEGAGSVDGLRPKTAYRLIVSGDLTDDGTTVDAANRNITVGVCVVNTPALEQVGITLTYLDKDDGNRETLRDSTLKLFTTRDPNAVVDPSQPADPAADELSAGLLRQQQTLTTLTIEAYDSLTATEPAARLVLKEENYAALLVDAGIKSADDPDMPASLGELMEEGLPLTERLFIKGGNSTYTTLNKSAQYIRVSALMDYTALPDNTKNQNAYIPSDPNSTEEGRLDGAGYTNQYTMKAVGYTRKNDIVGADVVGATEGVSMTFEVQLGATPDPIPAPEKGITVTRSDDNKDSVTDRYTLAAEYTNASKQARWITFYVFDYVDFHADYTDPNLGLRYDNGENGAFAGVPDGFRYRTAVTMVDSEGNGKWLAKIRVPIPSTGEFKNLMPKVEFIPQTAASYFAGKDSELTAYNELLGRITGKTYEEASRVVASGNTWKLFYPDKGENTEKKTGHQFVFAWTMEYESTQDGATVMKYYPFQIEGRNTGYKAVGAGSPDYYKGIPHSAVQCAPRRVPTVFAKPWKSDLHSDTVTWKVWISDPDGAVVTNGTTLDGLPCADFYRYNDVNSGLPLWTDENVNTRPQAKVHPNEPETDSTGADEVAMWVTTATATSPVMSTSLRIQLYENKYTGSGGAIADDNLSYQTVVVNNHTKDNRGPLGVYQQAFILNYDKSSFLTEFEAGSCASATAVTVNKQAGDIVNQYEITVTGSAAYLQKVNGIRLTFTDKNNAQNKVVLDKFVRTAIDKLSDVWVSENGDIISFRVNIARELSSLAGKEVQLTADLIYESGSEGFSYIGGSNPVSLVYYSNSAMKTRQWYSYVSSTGGVQPQLALSGQSEKAPRWGSFFTITAAAGDWPGTLVMTSTRTALWTDSGWRDMEIGGIKYTGKTGANGLVPRLLALKPVIRQFSGDAFKAGTNDCIEVPQTIPVITYAASTTKYTNYVAQDYTLTGTSDVYFALYKPDGTNNVLLQGTADGQGVTTWVTATKSIDQLTPSNYQDDGYKGILWKYSGAGTVSFGGLQANTQYYIRAYYWDAAAGKFKLLNMPGDNGDLTPNAKSFTTAANPQLDWSAKYYTTGYYHKGVQTNVRVLSLADYYYTLELLDENGALITYMGCESDRNLSGFSNKYFSFSRNERTVNGADSYLVYQNNGDFTVNPNDPRAYPQLTDPGANGQRVYLDYTKTYQVRLSLYNIGMGPAYGKGNAILSEVKSFTLNTEKDNVGLSGNFDLVTDSNTGVATPTVSFTIRPSFKSYRLRYQAFAAVVVREHTGFNAQGVPTTTYTDVTNRVVDSLTSEHPGYCDLHLPGISGRTLSLELTGEDAVNDKFHCFIYAIEDNVNTVTTKGFDFVYNNSAVRSGVIAGRLTYQDGGARELTQSSFQNLKRNEIEVKDNDIVTGTSRLLSLSTITYTGNEVSAGKVTMIPVGGDVQVLLTDPVKVGKITSATWSIDAAYTLEGDEEEHHVVFGVSNEAVSIVKNGSNYQFMMGPNFRDLPSNATVQNYYISLVLFDDNGRSVTMTPGGNSGTVTSNGDPTDPIYTLTQTIDMSA